MISGELPGWGGKEGTIGAVALQRPIVGVGMAALLPSVLEDGAGLRGVHTVWPQSPRDFWTICLAIL